MSQYQCGSCRQTFAVAADYCPYCKIPFSRTVEGEHHPVPPAPMSKEEQEGFLGLLGLLTIFAPAGLYVLFLYRMDLLSAWPVTLGVTAFLVIGVIGSSLIIPNDKPATIGVEVWNGLAALTTLLPAELCILTLYSLKLASVWTVIGGLVAGLTLGGTLSYLLIGDKDRPGALRRAIRALRRET